jgi:hypothetical protein
MTSRELWVFVTQLPEASATKAALREDPWTLADHHRASQIDAIRHLDAQYVSANGGQAHFEPLHRPAFDKDIAEAKSIQQSLHDLISGDLVLEADQAAIPQRGPEIETF